MSTNSCHRIGSVFACVLLGLLAGCGTSEPKRKSVYAVNGKVLVNNQGIGGVVVSFHPKDEIGNPRSQKSFTTTEADGSFRLTTYETHDGAPAGQYVVTLYWPGKVPTGSPIGEVGPDQFRGRYADPKTSPLQATIRPEPNVLEPFKVTLP